MIEAARHDIELGGCTPEPLMAYLKALGILRLVSEQKDPEARGWWKNDVFWVRSSLDRDAFVSFFIDEYRPTPIVAPWAGGSGFFKKDDKQAINALSQSNSPRVRLYTEVIGKVQEIIKEEHISETPRDNDKANLIRRYRSELPDEVVTWMDAAMVLQQDKQNFAPLLGTGGNDGRLNFTQNFMQRIVSLSLQKAEAANNNSYSLIETSLYATAATLDSASVGQFAPGRAGGPNATQGMEGGSTDNPWDFVLTIEGALSFAGAAARRLGVAGASRAAFPFTVRAVAAGFDSSATNDEVPSRGELWLPLWTRPTSTSELRQLFGEGRAEVSGRPARNGIDFARAVAGLGVDRGIAGFSRFGFLKRSGKAFLAAPLGHFDVIERSAVDLLREIDGWLDRFRSACFAKQSPPRFSSSLHFIDSAIFEFCKYGGAALFQEILVALGAAERALAGAERFRDDRKLRPLNRLSSAWVAAADDRSREFAIARALASVHDPETKIGPLRANLELVDWKQRCAKWAEKDRAVVWSTANLATNLSNVLQRRIVDGARAGCVRLPVGSRVTAPLDTVAAFIAGEIDDERIEKLLWGLMLISDAGNRRLEARGANETPIPRAYALLKLLFLPRPLVIDRGADGRLFGRMLRNNESGGIAVGREPSISQLLRAGRLGEACMIAMRRLRASGLAPMPTPIRGLRVRDADWLELKHFSHSGIDPHRLAAALLIPIGDDAVGRLVRLVISSDDSVDDQSQTVSGTTSQEGTPS
jgi:CRISPR-associated protein Csx17